MVKGGLDLAGSASILRHLISLEQASEQVLLAPCAGGSNVLGHTADSLRQAPRLAREHGHAALGVGQGRPQRKPRLNVWDV